MNIEPSITSTFFTLINNLNNVKNHFKNTFSIPFDPVDTINKHSSEGTISRSFVSGTNFISNKLYEMNKMFSSIKDTYKNTVNLFDKISEKMKLPDNDEENVITSIQDIILSCSILVVLYCLKRISINKEQEESKKFNLSNSEVICNTHTEIRMIEVLEGNKSHPEGISCSICFEEFSKIKKDLDLPYEYLIYKTVCNHTFCIYCINKWLENKNSCPLCRTIIK